MLLLLTLLLSMAAAALLLPAIFLFCQTVGAGKGEAITSAALAHDGPKRPSVAILIPAHNESSGLLPTLHSISGEWIPGIDRVLVVADNCTDDTAACARSVGGVEVLERHDTSRMGKGYALDHGFQHLNAQPCDVLLILDADCLVKQGSIALLTESAARSGRPAQALYLMRNGVPDPTPRERFSEFAWTVKNLVRPRGSHRMGLPCHLLGTGMAFPWPLIQRHSLASGHLVEDMQLGMELACAGQAPRFVESALVTSEFPRDEEAQTKQRTRWEHGHIGLAASIIPVLLRSGLAKGLKGRLALTLDLLVPPLTLFVMLLGIMTFVAATWAWFTGMTAPLMLTLSATACVAFAVLRSWRLVGTDILPPAQARKALLYVFWKIPVYIKFLTNRQVEWVRSKRNTHHD